MRLLFPLPLWAITVGLPLPISAHGQEPTPPVPRAPHLRAPGENIKWTISEKSGEQSEAVTVPAPLHLESTTVYFSKHVEFIEKKWSNGKNTRAWVFGSYVLEEASYDKNVIEVKAMGLSGIPDIRNNPYAELPWVDSSSFKGVVKLDGRECFLYGRASSVSPTDVIIPPSAQGGNEKVDSAADISEQVWVDVGTQAPVRHAVHGKTLTFSYSHWDGVIPNPPQAIIDHKNALHLR